MFIRNERFYPNQRTLAVLGGAVLVPPMALIVWVSLARNRLPECPKVSRRFPVVVDTGFGHNLLIREKQATDWAGLTIAATGLLQGVVADASGYKLNRLQDCTFEGVSGATGTCPAFWADLWLHSEAIGGESIRLELPEGFVLCPTPTVLGSPPGPRLPLLGGRALYVNDMKLVIDYKNLDFSLGAQY